MFDYEALQERCREHGDELRRHADVERLARQARARRQRRRQRFALDAAFGFFRGAQRQLRAGA